MRNYNESLTQILHEAFVACGQILNSDHVAEFIGNFEYENEIELTESVIRSSVFEARDRTCDSFIGNAIDSRSDWGDEQVEEEIAKWEAQRPAKVRRKQIEAILAAPEVEAAAKVTVEQHLKNRSKVQRRVDNAYLNPELKKATVRSIARDAFALNVITQSDFGDVCRILDDRKQCAEDALSEVQGSVNARA